MNDLCKASNKASEKISDETSNTTFDEASDVASFKKIFGEDDADSEVRVFHAPGRVNIIGEHIDYNGGCVLPFALTMGTRALVRKNGSGIARFASANFDGVAEVPLDNIAYDPARDWANYPAGVLHFMQTLPSAGVHESSLSLNPKKLPSAGVHEGSLSLNPKKLPSAGVDMYFSSDLPNGAGLSSSASVTLVTATALDSVLSLGYTPLELVKLAQKVENDFCNVSCGIMDQFAVGMCKKGYALHLNCDTLEHKHIPLNLGEYSFIIMDTKKRRRLNESKYNERRAECELARKILGEFTPKNLHAKSSELSDEIIHKRAKHVVGEIQRVKQAVAALENGDTTTLGTLLNSSHASLRDFFEVSCHELDTIVAEAIKHPACVGARMTGAGFGGCAIALVTKANAPDFIKSVSASYEKAIGHSPAMYICESGNGVGIEKIGGLL